MIKIYLDEWECKSTIQALNEMIKFLEYETKQKGWKNLQEYEKENECTNLYTIVKEKIEKAMK